MQFQVPQFIETEDTVVGPFSIRQFLYVGAAGAISAVLYFLVQAWLWTLATMILGAISIGLAFIKIGGRPLTEVALSAFNFYWKPQTYVWQPDHPEIEKTSSAMEEEAPQAGIPIEKIVSGMALKSVWQELQTGEKMSGSQYLQKKLQERYQIFQRVAGDRRAARRVDYR